MSTDIIVSYDGTSNDDDALVLGRLFAGAGARLALAYVRHAREFDSACEQLAQDDAERRLEQGARLLETPDVPRHVVMSASTGEGLAQLAEQEGASIIVFGSDYRTTPGHVEPGGTAQYLLEGGPIAIAIAPAGLRAVPDPRIGAVGVSASGDPAVEATVSELVAQLGARRAESNLDLIVVGSQVGAPEGRIALSGATRAALDSADSALLVLPRGKPLSL